MATYMGEYEARTLTRDGLASVDVDEGTIRLTATQTATWHEGDGPTMDALGKSVREIALDVSRERGCKPVEVYDDDGIVLEQITADAEE